jgi:lysophospholipid acyltransferase (LPLAT)-like uncharacterized protein
LPGPGASAQQQAELLVQALDLLRAGQMLALLPADRGVAASGLEPLIALAQREGLALAVLPLALARLPGVRLSAWPQAQLSVGFSQGAATAQGVQCQLSGLRKRLIAIGTLS